MSPVIFVVGLDDFNLKQIKTLPEANEYSFKPLCNFSELKQQDHFPVQELVQKAKKYSQDSDYNVAAVIGYWDFPVSTILPILRIVMGLQGGPSLESVLKCEHKYWSRLEQYRLMPTCTPAFYAFNPFNVKYTEIPLKPPFWIKPIKAASSFLAFKIENKKDFVEAINKIKVQIDKWAKAFNFILKHANLPDKIKDIDGFWCIAEETISEGYQITQEGYSFKGEVEIYGTVDSFRSGRYQSCFSRYQYPSQLPKHITDRMTSVSKNLIKAIKYDNGAFNIEYYYSPKTDEIKLLEINARISKSHAPLFEMVDGYYHHKVIIDLALGKKPEFPSSSGRFQLAAKFMLRVFQDGIVKSVPNSADLQRLHKRFPEALFHSSVKSGDRLSDLKNQDSYSYEIGVLFLGGTNENELKTKYEEALQILNIQLDLDIEEDNKRISRYDHLQELAL